MSRRRGTDALSVWRLLVLALPFVLAAPSAAQTVQPPAEPLTLQAALTYASDHYPSIRAALEQTRAATSQVRVAQATSLPRLDAVWQTNRATANNVFGQVLPQSVIPAMSGPVLPSASGASVWGSAVGALLSWEPVDFGIRAAAVDEAQQVASQAGANEAVTRLAVQAAVGAAFLAVAQADHAVIAAEADVQRRDVLARAAHVLADNQLRPGADASRADAERAGALTRAIQARQAAAVARIDLARLLGLPSASIAIEASGVAAAPAASVDVSGTAPDHPSARAQLAAVHVAQAREMVIGASNRPRVLLQSALFARGTGAATDGAFNGGANGLLPERVNWAAGVQVVVPNLFEYAPLRARRAAAAALTRANQARYDESLLAVTAQQRRAEAVVDATRAVAENTPLQVAAARLSEQQARARYEAGLGSLMEVADSQSLLAQSEYQDLAARIDVWRSLLDQAAAHGDFTPLLNQLTAGGGR